MKNARVRLSLIVGAAILVVLLPNAHAEFLFTGNENFITPTLDYESSLTRYSEWRVFYSRSTIGNLPDWYAEFGGIEVSPGIWQPTPRPADDPAFPAQPQYTSNSPNAFWNIGNPTITQTNSSTGYITAGGNFYGVAGNQGFRLGDNTMATSDAVAHPGYNARTVVFQFQTDGQLIDLSNIRLGYMENGEEKFIFANDLNRAEMLREYATPEGSSLDPSASEGMRNRVAIQWDLSGLDISQYHIYWEAIAHTSFQQAALDTSDHYTPAFATSRTWTGGSGSWADGANWWRSGQVPASGSFPETNGNIRFENNGSANIAIETNKTIGALSFLSPEDVTISIAEGASLTTNTGIATSSSAVGNYLIDGNLALGALGMFEIAAGTVKMKGPVSGSHGIVKSGDGTLVLQNDNTFSGFLDVQGGVVRLEGANAYAGRTNIRFGEVVVAADSALGTAPAISLSVPSSVYSDIPEASLVIEGSRIVDKDVEMKAGIFRKILATRQTGPLGATFSGNLLFPSASSDVRLRAEGSDDMLRFTGQITGAGDSRSNTITLDGQGTVALSGAAKNFRASINISSGTLLLQTTIQDASGVGHMTIRNGATLRLEGIGKLAGTKTTFPAWNPLLIIEGGGRVSGNGEITREVITQVGAILAAVTGAPLAIKTLDVSSGAEFEFSLGSDTAVAFAISDQFITGEGGIDISFLSLTGARADTTYDLISWGAGTLDLTRLNLHGSSGFVLDETFGTDGWNIANNTLQVRFAAIPEPKVFLLFALAVLIFWRIPFRSKA